MSRSDPPKWANRLLEKLCPESLLEEVQGDLHEAYHWRVKERGVFRARWLFALEAIRMSRPGKIRPVNSLNNYLMMHKNYLKTGWRFLKKNTLYSILNILGLAMGISFCWLAYLYADDEMNYDQYLTDHDKMFRIVADMKNGDDIHHIGGSSHAMSIQFEEKIPEIDQVVKIKTGGGMIRKGEEVLQQSYLFADQNLTELLELEFLEGTAGTFDLPNDVIISEKLAGKLDLRGKAVGEILTLNGGDGDEEFIIRGVYKDIPLNTSVRRDMIISYASYVANAPERRLTTWFDVNMNTLIKLHDPKTKGAVEKKMTQMHNENDDGEGEVALKLQQLSEIHLNRTYGHYNGISRGGNVGMIKLFTGIGFFCLIISMINYSNFNISLYINRAREVALRKVIGAQKSGIFNQLITESFLSCFIAGLLAFIVLIAILPFFSDFVSKSYDLSFLVNGRFALGAFIILIATAIISGVYPAFVLSRFSIIKSLKGEQKIRSGKWITQTLLGVQFIIATGLVAGMLTMKEQVSYLSNFDTKVNIDNVIYMDYIPAEESQIKQFMAELDQYPEIAEIAAISGYNGTRITSGEIQFDVRHLRINRDLINLLDIDITNGRNFDEQLISDKNNGILVNETFVKKMQLDDPIGVSVPFSYGDLEDPVIIGVVEDYLFESAKNDVDPLVIYLSEQYPLQSVYVRLHDNAVFSQEKFEETWSKAFDPFPFEFTFLEEYYQSAYTAENRMITLVGAGCIVSIFLAAMGLLGIVGLQLNQRFKEISIRKVLGATAGNLYQVFTKRYVLIISAGLIGGLGISYYAINAWLDNYPFHVEFGTGIMILTILFTLTIALITILSQVFKVVHANPVKFLRDE
ncbi:MAG: FtsX-like permease family protein [Cyclobacteriaceae bacterium]